MKNLLVIGLMVLGMSVAQASSDTNIPCITYRDAMNAAIRLPSTVPAEELPALREGWVWMQTYMPSRDPELQFESWLSWPDGETLTLCQ